jgi:hypothetical protein
MANIVYKMYFDEYNGEECTVYIKKSGYVGAEVQVDGGPEPCVINMLAEGDEKFVHIKGTECTLQLVSSSSLQYLSLFLEPVKTYWVDIYKGATLVWKGWVNPEYYSEPFASPPYITTIHCTDGIAELKNIPFPLPGPTAADFKKSVIYYIAKSLEQIGFSSSMDIYLSMDIVANTSLGQKTERVFEELFIDYRTFRSGGKFISCYDVLEHILKAFNARLVQNKWNWWIERLDQKHTTYRVEQYSGTGVYIATNPAYDAVVALTPHVGVGSDVRFKNGAMLEVQPAYKKFKIIQDYGQRTNILPFSNYEGEFNDEDWVNSSTLRYWDATAGTIPAIVEQVTFENSQVLMMKPLDEPDIVAAFYGYITPYETGSPLSRYIWTLNEGGTDEDGFLNWIAGTATLHLKFSAFINRAPYPWSHGGVDQDIDFHIRLWADFSGHVYTCWFSHNSISEFEWVLVGDPGPAFPYQNGINIEPEKGKWYDGDALLPPPWPELGVTQTYIGFKIDISSPTFNQDDSSTGDGILFKGIQLYISDDRDSEKIRTYETDIDNDNIVEPEDYDVRFGDTPYPYTTDGCGLINRYVLYDKDLVAVNYFGIYGDTHIISHLVETIIKTDLEVTYRFPLFKLKGTLVDTVGVVDFITCLKDYNNRFYICTGLAYNLKDSTFEGEWLQMWDESGG